MYLERHGWPWRTRGCTFAGKKCCCEPRTIDSFVRHSSAEWMKTRRQTLSIIALVHRINWACFKPLQFLYFEAFCEENTTVAFKAPKKKSLELVSAIPCWRRDARIEQECYSYPGFRYLVFTVNKRALTTIIVGNLYVVLFLREFITCIRDWISCVLLNVRAIFPFRDVIDNRSCTLEKVKLDRQIVTRLTTPLSLFVVNVFSVFKFPISS